MENGSRVMPLYSIDTFRYWARYSANCSVNAWAAESFKQGRKVMIEILDDYFHPGFGRLRRFLITDFKCSKGCPVFR